MCVNDNDLYLICRRFHGTPCAVNLTTLPSYMATEEVTAMFLPHALFPMMLDGVCRLTMLWNAVRPSVRPCIFTAHETRSTGHYTFCPCRWSLVSVHSLHLLLHYRGCAPARREWLPFVGHDIDACFPSLLIHAEQRRPPRSSLRLEL